MTKVLYDGSIFLHQKIGGISRYIIKLNEKNRTFGIKSVIFTPISINDILDNKIENIKTFVKLKKIPIFCTKILYFINNFLTLIYIKLYKPDVLHLTYYNNFLLKLVKIPYIVTIYDLIHEKLKKKQFQFKKSELIKKSKHIICISEQTKKDLIKFYKVQKSKISVIHLGSESKIKKTNFKKKKIVLFVGSRIGYKNFINLIKAFAKSNYLKTNFKIVCFGGDKPNFEEMRLIEKLGLKKNVIFENGNDKKLNNFYKVSSLYISTSLFEGFGLTTLEAMRMGCPVICSNIPVFKEILDDACYYVDPKNIDNIKNKLEKLLRSKKEQKRLINKGYRIVLKYNWKKCIFKTSKIYNKISFNEKKTDFSFNNKL